MFQMINEDKPAPGEGRLIWMKVGMFIIIAAVFAGVVYFFAFVPWSR